MFPHRLPAQGKEEKKIIVYGTLNVLNLILSPFISIRVLSGRINAFKMVYVDKRISYINILSENRAYIFLTIL